MQGDGAPKDSQQHPTSSGAAYPPVEITTKLRFMNSVLLVGVKVGTFQIAFYRFFMIFCIRTFQIVFSPCLVAGARDISNSISPCIVAGA